MSLEQKPAPIRPARSVIDVLSSGPRSNAALFGVVFVIVVLMRAPFLGPGYGTDADSWGVAYTARHLAETGHYITSRFPGYPVQEFVCSLLWRGGPLLLCGASAAMSAIAAGFFALIFRRAGGAAALLAALALASVPTIHIVSVQALDNAWGLAFALASWYAALNSRAALAGVLLGLGIGTRLPTIVWFIPLATTLAGSGGSEQRLRRILTFAAAAFLVAAVAFAPLYIPLGLGFLRTYGDTDPPFLWISKLLSVDLWGVPGTLALLVVVPLALWPRRAQPSAAVLDRPLPKGELLGWLAGIAGVLALFAWLPLDSAYLIPAVPLTLMLLAYRLRRTAFTVLCVALLASPWLLKFRLVEAGDEPSSSAIGPFAFAGQSLVLDVFRGPAFENQVRRRRDVRECDRMLEQARALTGESVLVVDAWLPMIRAKLNGTRLGNATFVTHLDAAEARRLRAHGVTVVDPFPE